MAKSSGIGDRLFVNSTDLSGDIGSITAINVTRELLRVTSIVSSAEERILGRADGEISFAAFHNTSTGAHSVLSAIGTADCIVSVAHGATAGSPAASLIAKKVDYNTTLGEDGSLAHTSTARSNGAAVEWGVMQSAGTASFAGTAQGGTVDGAAQSTSGGAAYLHIFSIGAGTATFSVQDSSDGSTGWANVTGLVFTAASAVTSERVATAAGATIKRYTRANCTNPGGGTAVAFLNFARY